jgi:hypothetical protein
MEAPNPPALGRKLGRRIQKAKLISGLFSEERVTKAILQFLKDIDIGKRSTDTSLSDEGFEWD